MVIVHEKDIETLDMPGRKLKWLFHPEDGKSEQFSMNVIRIEPGETVKPAHAHPNEEELIYIISGQGEVYVDGEIESIQAGHAVKFPAGAVHMVRNTSEEVMKIVCFFTPPVDFNQYQFYEDVSFPKTPNK